MDTTGRGAVVRQLDFGDLPSVRAIAPGNRRGLRLATASSTLRGPEQYQVLDLRRRRAQIRARRALESLRS